jgi:hypothetical protein
VDEFTGKKNSFSYFLSSRNWVKGSGFKKAKIKEKEKIKKVPELTSLMFSLPGE